MVQTNNDWLTPTDGTTVNTKTEMGFDPQNDLTIEHQLPPSPPDGVVVEVEVLEVTPYVQSEQGSNSNPLTLEDLDGIYASGDFARLHPHLQSGSIVVLPKEQLTEFMAQMRDNMVLLNGLNTLAEVIKPIVQESDEGKAILGFLTSNSGLFTGKEIGVVEAMKLATGIPALLRNFKALLGNVDVNLLRENAAFVDEFRAVLRRNNSPFLTTISSLGDGLNQLKQ